MFYLIKHNIFNNNNTLAIIIIIIETGRSIFADIDKAV